MTWPVARHVATAIPDNLGDPLLNAWNLGWDAHRLLRVLYGDAAALAVVVGLTAPFLAPYGALRASGPAWRDTGSGVIRPIAFLYCKTVIGHNPAEPEPKRLGRVISGLRPTATISFPRRQRLFA